MRAYLRVMLMTLLVSLVALAGWSFIRRSTTPDRASAAAALRVPPFCVPAELAGIQAALSKANDPAARQALQAKQQAAEQSARDCASNATAHPPARKPAGGGLQPTDVPESMPVPMPGIQHAELLPSDDFIPVEDGQNMWAGTLGGHTIEIYAGSAAAADENWQAEHPEWASQPEFHVQGALRVVVDSDSLHASLFPTNGRHGALHFISACEPLLVAHAADGKLFTFDASSLAYVNGPDACPAPTP